MGWAPHPLFGNDGAALRAETLKDAQGLDAWTLYIMAGTGIGRYVDTI